MCVCACMGGSLGEAIPKVLSPHPPQAGLGKCGKNMSVTASSSYSLPHTCMHTTPPLSQMHICTHITYTLHSFLRTHAHTHAHTSHSTDSHTVTHMHMHTPHSPSSRWEGNSPPSPHTPSIDPTTSTTKSLPGAGCGNEICGMHVAIVESGHKVG